MIRLKKYFWAVFVFSIVLFGCARDPEFVYFDPNIRDHMAEYAVPTATPRPTLAPDERDFRDMKWGMSIEDITALEGEDYTKQPGGVIRYEDLYVGGFPAQAEYTLEDGKLVQCVYYTTHFENTMQQYVDDYELLKVKYTKKYGTPIYDEQKWADDMQAQEQQKPLQALAEGRMMYRIGWKFSNTEINLVLFKDKDLRIKVGIRYQPIDKNIVSDVAPVGDEDI